MLKFIKDLLDLWTHEYYHSPMNVIATNDIPMDDPSVDQFALTAEEKAAAAKPVEALIRPPLLQQFCLAIRDFEGAPGDRNYRNCNPGNARFSHVGYMPIYGHVGKDEKGFAIFRDYATGWLYLNNLVKSKVREHPNQTILEFMHVYAPVGDDNDPNVYSAFIAKRLGVDVNYPMKNIIA